MILLYPCQANAGTLYSRISRWSVFSPEGTGEMVGGKDGKLGAIFEDRNLPLKAVITCNLMLAVFWFSFMVLGLTA